MTNVEDILSNIAGAVAGNKKDKDGLYGLIFGNKTIPVSVSLAPETEIILLCAVGLAGLAAVAVALVLPKR
jgi:hypothetical protein